ncbi:MAG TPA: hypothetical protein ENK61_07210 [Devosia sp.]|nr:hypothetical protein [Devosia sp.]
MKAFFHRLAAAYGSAIILMFFSEYFFVNEQPVAQLLVTLKTSPLLAIPALVSFAGFYTFFTYPMLMALSHFNVRTLSGLLLAGALFGWATEGLTIPVVYQDMPVSFVFPSIGWHALIDVLIGWYLVRLGMRGFGPFGNGVMFVALGVAWGVWATWYWGAEEGVAPLLPDEFVLLVLASAGFWILGMMLADRFAAMAFRASRWEVAFIIILALGLVGVMAYPYLPVSIAIVPLVGASVLAMWWGKNLGEGQTVLQRLSSETVPKWTYVLAFLTPVSAISTYWVVFETKVQVPTQTIVLTLLSIGVVWFAIALVLPLFGRLKNNRSA